MEERDFVTSFIRALTYLQFLPRLGGQPIADRAVRAVQKAAAVDRRRVISGTLDELHVGDSAPSAAPVTPPIQRGHIGYPSLTSTLGERDHQPLKTWRGAALRRRGLMTLLVLTQTLFASYFMAGALPDQRLTILDIALVAVFAVLFAWISVGFWTAMFGFAIRMMGGDPWSLLRRYPSEALSATPLARTAIVMPIYHEPIDRCMRGLRSVYRSLAATGQLGNFEFYLLSDSRDPNVWLTEQTAYDELRRELGDDAPIYYRRRVVNLRHKSGNIADFLRRWGRRFRYMVVLDVDSIMSGETLVRMVQLMQREPQVGILQTVPRICHAASPFALIQQFANCVYGPLFATGLASIQLGEAVYWGHNAIIRIAPFMRHCGLRRLNGPGLFKGPILSHDFVEAACMGRAGYEVWLEPALSQSYEESPPTLFDELSRDRRWVKGNLQHLWLVVFGRRIPFAHRLALINGALSYLISPLWMLFLALSTIKVASFTLYPINYFPHGRSLFPLWPVWHPEWAIHLAVSTAFLLFMPKVLAVMDVALRDHSRRVHGGVWKLLFAIVLESLASALFAPIKMVSHTRFVSEALCNVRVRWAGQNRGEEIPWAMALRASGLVTLLAVAWATLAFCLQPLFFYWSLPVAVPLVLAAPLTVSLSRKRIGHLLRRHRVFPVPELFAPPTVLQDVHTPLLRSFKLLPMSAFETAIIDPRRNQLHRRFARRHQPHCARDFETLAQRCLEYGQWALSTEQTSMLARDAEALAWLHHRAWRAPDDSVWNSKIGDIWRWTVHTDRSVTVSEYAAFSARQDLAPVLTTTW